MLEAPAAVLDALRGLPILSADQLAELEREHVLKALNASDLARQMIRLKWITIYQAKKILSERASDLVIGHYVIQDKLGEGGMGRVYRAVQLNLHRIVALKVVRSSLLKNEIALKRFKREVKAAAALSHPNIVRVFDADHAGERHFLAMEYIEGSDLGRLVREHGPLPVSVACSFMRQAALGLQHAHDLSFVHRDIKPSNLLVAVNDKGQYGPKNVVKILDMGLAREQTTDPNAEHLSTELTRTGTVVGTPDYMSPEQAKNSSNVDHRSDLYALGCTFFYLLTGEVVFPNGNPLEKLLSHQMDAPRSIALIRMDTPPEVASIIQCLLAKKPEQRFQSGAALANALEPWCTGKGSTGLQPVVVLQAEAVDPESVTIDTAKPGSPFDFGDFDDNDDEPTRSRPSDEQPTAITQTAKIPPHRGWLVLGLLAILSVGLLVGGTLGYQQWKKKTTEPTPGDTPRPDNPKPKTDPKVEPKTDPKTVLVPKDLDVIEKYLPNDTNVLVVVDVKAFQNTPPLRDGIMQPLATQLKKFKTTTGVDLTTAVERMIVSYPVAENDDIFVILQGKTLVTEQLLQGIRKLPNIRTERYDDKTDLFIIPWDAEDRPLLAVATDASILLSFQRRRLDEALAKRDGLKKTKLNDASIEAAMRMMNAKPVSPHGLFVAVGLRTGLLRFVPVAGRLNFALAVVQFDERTMTFHTMADELESGKGAEFQGLLAKFLGGKLKPDEVVEPRKQRLADLLTKALQNNGIKMRYYHSVARIPYDKIPEWFGPFLPFELED